MDYLCNLKKEELSCLDIIELRINLYKVKSDISASSFTKIKSYLLKEGLLMKFSLFLQDYQNELNRLQIEQRDKKEYEIFQKEKAERNQKNEIENKIERENSLKYWLENYPKYFERGTIIINRLCISTYPCHHSLSLEYVNDEGIKTIQNFSSFDGEARVILDLLKKYPNAKWSEDKSYFDNIQINHPIEHFKNYTI
jgi:hypothetical protein